MKPLYTTPQFEIAKSKDLLEMQCYECSNSFFTAKSNIVRELKTNEGWVRYCSKSCVGKQRTMPIKGNPPKEVKCLNCSKKFYRKASQIKRHSNHFCSHSCAATYNNKARKKLNNCNNCGIEIKNNPDTIHCASCHKDFLFSKRKITLIEKEKLTIKELAYGNKRNKNIRIHRASRDKMELENIAKQCNYCYISYPLDVCHIIPISSFSETTLISEVNDLSNLVYLCKNHHWMYDRGEIELD